MTVQHNVPHGGRSFIQVLRLGAGICFQRFCSWPLYNLWSRISLACWGAHWGAGLRVHGRLRIRNGGRMVIGRNVRINSGPANYVGGDSRMAFWVGSKGALEIGDNCALSNSTIVCTDSIRIGEGTYIGGGCDIYDTDFHQLDPNNRIANRGAIGHGPIEIGPRAFIGGGTMILKNVTIGEGAVVGAGSVVTKSIAPYEIWSGVPIRFIRKLDISNDVSSL